MQPIIRRTITITITETWTITWADGQETVWEEMHEVAYPTTNEPAIPQSSIAEEQAHDGDKIDPDTDDPIVEDE